MKKLVFLIIPLLLIACQQENNVHCVLNADFADPSIIQDGENYYMTNTSLGYLPGLIIWKSKNLMDWKPVGHALDTYMGEVWAPDFVKYNDKYYIYFPVQGTNYVVYADKPEGPWSVPVEIPVNYIDPGHIATPQGDRYLMFSKGYIGKLSDDGLSMVSEVQKVYDGWPIPEDYTVECPCLESPKLLYKNGYYYLTSAMGGTAGPSTSHMAVVSRTKSLYGNWEHCPFNPVIKTMHHTEEWWSKGHATIFGNDESGWHTVYHAYKNGHLPQGRQVLIEPVEWTNDNWYKLKFKDKPAKTIVHENIVIRPDNFNDDKLNYQWRLQGVQSTHEIKPINSTVILENDGNTHKVLFATPGDISYKASVKIDSVSKNAKAGFALYYNSEAYAGWGINNSEIYNVANGKKSFGPSIEIEQTVYLQLTKNQYDLKLSYSLDGKNWTSYPNGLEVSGYQHNMLGGFASLRLAVFIEGTGKIYIDNFDYTATID